MQEVSFARGSGFTRGLGGVPILPLKSPRAPHNPLETATEGARRPRRGAAPDNPARKCKHSLPDWAYRSGFHQTELFGGFFLYPSDRLSPGGSRVRRGVAPDNPARNANMVSPIGLAVLSAIRPVFFGE